MTDLIEQIEVYLQDVEILSNIIERSNFVIEKLDGNEELQHEYHEQLKPTILEYKQTVQALQFLFKEYFEWEKKSRKVRNLRYRRLHKMFLKELFKEVPPTSTPA